MCFFLYLFLDCLVCAKEQSEVVFFFRLGGFRIELVVSFGRIFLNFPTTTKRRRKWKNLCDFLSKKKKKSEKKEKSFYLLRFSRSAVLQCQCGLVCVCVCECFIQQKNRFTPICVLNLNKFDRKREEKNNLQFRAMMIRNAC